jgi:hypothetical protein
VSLKIAVFWDVTLWALVRADVTEKPSASIIRVTRISELGKLEIILRSLRRLLVIANVPRSQILVSLMMEALHFFATSIFKDIHGVTSKKMTFFNFLVDTR